MVDVLFLPKRIDEKDACVVVVDVLRATSTIVTALANGARAVIPVRTVAQAKRMKKQDVLICGERQGIKPQHFDLGNSPQEYLNVADKEIVLTTTNGTKAISMVNSRRVYAAAFLNLTVISDLMRSCEKITIVCSGQDNAVALEDVLCAGALVYQSGLKKLTDAAQIALRLWKQAKRKDLSKLLAISQHGRELKKYGFSGDIEFCAQIDKYKVIPVLTKDGFVVEK
ncbi:2-phosphosulfolactate phosphatase family protein [Pseudothermotoga sp. U03pept]|uniref:2-phosphosulfolactate phosphatase family protein n=1 Tax=Pseudothermotoga sp. U03pept TaxID=3447012 RepID=UPI003EFDC919